MICMRVSHSFVIPQKPPSKRCRIRSSFIAGIYYETCHEKTCLCHMQPTKMQISLHIHSLISTFVIRCLDSIIPIVATSEIPRLLLPSVVQPTGLSVTWSQTSEDFSRRGSHSFVNIMDTSLYTDNPIFSYRILQPHTGKTISVLVQDL